MKIAFHLNCLEHGGAERVVSNLSNQFAREGYDVLVATEWQGEEEFSLDDGVRRIHVGLAPEDEKKGRIYKIIKRVKNLRNFIKKEQPDVLVAFARKAIYRGLFAARGTGCPVCVCVRTDPVGHYDSRMDQLLIKYLFPQAAGFVFQTNGQRDFFPAYTHAKSVVILNPIHQKYIDEPAPAQREKVVVQSGRLVDFKNQAMLLDAFELVHRKHPDYCLKIYGHDTLDGTKEILERKIEENHAGDYVKLMGGSDRLEKEMKHAAVYAFSSDWEGLPNALMEAMALRLPVVATDCPCGGPATIMSHGKNGLLVPIKNPQALAEGICYLIEHPEEAEKMAAEAGRIAEIANAQAVYVQWKQYLEKICRRRG